MRDGGSAGAYAFAGPPLRCALACDLGGWPLVRLSGGGCACLEPVEPLFGADRPRERPLGPVRLHSVLCGLWWVVERLVVECMAFVGQARARIRLLRLASSDVLEVAHAGRLGAATIYRWQANATRR